MKIGMGNRIKLGTILIAGMLTLGVAILSFNVRKVMACNPPCDVILSCRVIPETQTICIGNTASFTCVPTGGNSGYTFTNTWPNGTITISPEGTAVAGTYTYTCTVTDASNCVRNALGR